MSRTVMLLILKQRAIHLNKEKDGENNPINIFLYQRSKLVTNYKVETHHCSVVVYFVPFILSLVLGNRR